MAGALRHQRQPGMTGTRRPVAAYEAQLAARSAEPLPDLTMMGRLELANAMVLQGEAPWGGYPLAGWIAARQASHGTSPAWTSSNQPRLSSVMSSSLRT